MIVDYANTNYQQSAAYSTYTQASQQATMATSYYSVPSSASATSGYPSQPAVAATSVASYSYNTGVPPNPAVSYPGYAVTPAAPGSVAAAAPPPPPMASADVSQYGMRPPLPPSQTAGAEVCFLHLIYMDTRVF